MKKTVGILTAVLLCGAALTGCGIPANTVHSTDDLVGKTIACQLGTTGYLFASDVENAKVDGYNKGEDAVQALVQGKADAVIIDSEPAKIFVEKNPSLVILDEPFAEEAYAIAYKKDNQKLGEKLDKALDELRADGTIDSIIGHWIGENADQVSYHAPAGTDYPDDGILIMATNAEFPPYESKSGGEIVGIDPDIMRAVCAKLGKQLVIQDMEFDSIFAAVDSGKADVGAAGITVTDERLQHVSFSQSYTTSKQVIIVRAE